MKASTVLRVLAGGLALFLITGLTAYARQSRSVKLVQPVSLVGANVAPGIYKVDWRGQSPKVRVTLRAGKIVVAAATGQWVQRNANYDRDALVCQTGNSGLLRIVEIQLAGKSQALVLDEAGSEAKLTSIVIPLCDASARGDGVASEPGGGCQHIQFLGKPTPSSRDRLPADPVFGDGIPEQTRTLIVQHK